ncbi:MAG: orotate phosphoribosyltransferase [Crenarchaeota archaeon]|nr:orotate phosphoribosyltransferase [Thermoproteota archaeon]
MNLEKNQIELIKGLSKIDALQFGLFTLSNGKVSPYYVDLKIAPSFPDTFRDICDALVQKITNEVGMESFDRIAGIPIAGIPFASQVAYNLRKPFLYVRKGVKLQGRERRVEGILSSGERVLLIDDLVTTGFSLKEAASAVRSEGGIVCEAVAFIDREEGGKSILEESGVKLGSIFKISDVAKELYEMGSLDDECLKTVMAQVKMSKKATKV